MRNQSNRLNITIISATQAHSPAIDILNRAAFGGPEEANLVRELRVSGDVALELVALGPDEAVRGHILFSTLQVQPATRRLAALAPLCVQPGQQHKGIGKALIQTGLGLCQQRGFDGIIVLGDPAYYTRFGFTRQKAENLITPYDGPALMAYEFLPGRLHDGKWQITYASAFSAL